MRDVSDESCRKNRNAQKSFPKNHVVCEIISRNMIEPEGPQMTSQCGAYELYVG
jgi:hypothetical protein